MILVTISSCNLNKLSISKVLSNLSDQTVSRFSVSTKLTVTLILFPASLISPLIRYLLQIFEICLKYLPRLYLIELYLVSLKTLLMKQQYLVLILQLNLFFLVL